MNSMWPKLQEPVAVLRANQKIRSSQPRQASSGLLELNPYRRIMVKNASTIQIVHVQSVFNGPRSSPADVLPAPKLQYSYALGLAVEP
jgi:hypothetical protein